MAGESVLYVKDVARLLGVKRETIHSHLARSRPGGRYESHPFPTPDGWAGIPDDSLAETDKRTGRPWWHADRADEILAWAQRRPGRGVGGGRPSWKSSPGAAV